MPPRVRERIPVCCPVVELRQYTLYPGQRDALVALFDREFVESQEAVGIEVIGQFHDLDDPDRFVWMRGFPDMQARAQALAAFYDGPVWQRHRNAANATMVDSDNVLLLRPATRGSSFFLGDRSRPPRSAETPQAGIVVTTIYYFDTPVDDSFAAFFAHSVAPVLVEAGTEMLALFVTETAANNFPRLPVREGENVFVWFARYDDADAHARQRVALSRMPQWSSVSLTLRQRIRREETLRLAPTARSLLPVIR